MEVEIDWTNDASVMNALLSNAWILEQAPERVRKNRTFVSAAISSVPFVFRFAHESLTGDKEFCLQAVALDGHLLSLATVELQRDKDVVLRAVQQNGLALCYADQVLCANKEVVLAAVACVGNALKYASPELQRDKDVVLQAVRQAGDALQHADVELRADSEVKAVAIATTPEAIEYAIPNGVTEVPVMIRKVTFDISNELLTGKFSSTFEDYASKDGYLTVRGDVWVNKTGMQGTFGLMIPAADRDVDAWEASRARGEVDWWGFVGMTTVRRKGDDGPKLQFFVEHHTFFDMPMQILAEIDALPDFAPYGFPAFYEEILEGWTGTWKLLQANLGARNLRDQEINW